jgi:hypothetical protein
MPRRNQKARQHPDHRRDWAPVLAELHRSWPWAKKSPPGPRKLQTRSRTDRGASTDTLPRSDEIATLIFGRAGRLA